jgi:hypothetical protein
MHAGWDEFGPQRRFYSAYPIVVLWRLLYTRSIPYESTVPWLSLQPLPYLNIIEGSTGYP